MRGAAGDGLQGRVMGWEDRTGLGAGALDKEEEQVPPVQAACRPQERHPCRKTPEVKQV